MLMRRSRYGISLEDTQTLDLVTQIARENNLSSRNRRFYLPLNNSYIAKAWPFRDGVAISVARLLRQLFSPGRRLLLSDCNADAILVKNNITAFYRNKGLIVKVFFSKEAMERHIEGWQVVSRMSPARILAPEIVKSSSSGAFYTIESLINGTKPGKPLVLTDEHIRGLSELHCTGAEIRERALNDDQRALIAKAIQACRTDAGPTIPAVLPALLRTPYGRVHGDLSAGNMLINGDKLWVIDWEDSGFGWITDDLPKILFRFNGDYRRKCIDAYAGKLGIPSGEFAEALLLPCVLFSSVPSNDGTIQFDQRKLLVVADLLQIAYGGNARKA